MGQRLGKDGTYCEKYKMFRAMTREEQRKEFHWKKGFLTDVKYAWAASGGGISTDGFITCEEFTRGLYISKLKDGEPVDPVKAEFGKRIFDAFDVNKDGKMSVCLFFSLLSVVVCVQ